MCQFPTGSGEFTGVILLDFMQLSVNQQKDTQEINVAQIYNCAKEFPVEAETAEKEQCMQSAEKEHDEVLTKWIFTL